jgi:iron complex transport system substrate-binding protein
MKYPVNHVIFCLLGLLFLIDVPLADSPQRIVSLAPHITEIIFRLGAGGRLVGRTEFSRYPKAAQEIPSVGGYLNPDYEKIVKLRPDLILQFPNSEHREKLEQLGYQVVEIPNETIDEIIHGIQIVGEILHLEKKTETVIAGIRDTLDLVRKRAKKPDSSPSALLVVGRQPGSLDGLYLAGNNTYLSQIWEICGGRNVFADAGQRYFSVNLEDLLKKDIDVILEFHPGWELTTTRRKKEKAVWTKLELTRAVREDNIRLYSDLMYMIPGPRISRIAMEFSKVIDQLK